MNQADLSPVTAPVDLVEQEFENTFVQELPGDPVAANYPRAVRNACYTRVDPTPVPAPRLLGMVEISRRHARHCTARRADERGGRSSRPAIACCPACSRMRRATAAINSATGQGSSATAARSRSPKSSMPDGKRFDLQLKGAGLTPYSRTADGRAVLRSSVREFMCSEAMHNLGVPTTRALSLTATGAMVIRDMFYDGNPAPEPGAIVCRVAPTFVRFGNFQIHAAQGEMIHSNVSPTT